MNIHSSVAALSAVLLAGNALFAVEPAIEKIAVYPPAISLTTAADAQQVVVVATRTDGVTVDVTSQAEFTLDDATKAKLEGSLVRPVGDGVTQLNVRHAGFSQSVPVEVAEAMTPRPVSFNLDVMPVFMRTGCNTGSCHGAARGKDGFRLSLFGFDPEGDYHRVTREMGGRRINLALPAQSLLLRKGSGAVPHTGGKRFSTESLYHETLRRWIADGAKQDAGETPKVVQLELFPESAVLEGEGATQQFVAVAHYADGTSRDVTELAVFLTSNDNSAAMDDSGLVTAGARGEAFVMARYETHTVGSQVLVLPEGLQYTPPKVTGNYIDELVGAKLRKLRMLPSELCSDEEFLRRVTIDITGKLPTVEEYDAFMSDDSPNKREALVDRLLKRKEFAEIWAMKWSELLMIKSSNQVSYKSMFLYSSWLTNQIANDVPLDKIVRDILGASGGTFSEPATNFYQIERDTLKTSENVAQVFMGFRIQCAQCHNHPFDRWTMDDYYSFAAFFSQIGRKQAEDYRETIIYNRNGGDVRHPVTNAVMEPKFLGGEVADVKGKDRRVVLAEWLTKPDNPYFATSVANRVWAHYFGTGIIDEVDDVRVSNPPSNPELYEALGKKLVEYKYDFKKLVRDICTSETYQRSARRNDSNAGDERNFAHANVRRIPAESLLDCISQATNTKDKFRGLPLGARAIQIADGRTSNYFLDTFGRSERETVCACEASTDPTLSQALHLLNGDTVNRKIDQGAVVAELLKQELTPEQVIEQLYVRCLSRKPRPDEVEKLMATVEAASNPQQGLEDVFWAILNSREFLFNH